MRANAVDVELWVLEKCFAKGPENRPRGHSLTGHAAVDLYVNRKGVRCAGNGPGERHELRCSGDDRRKVMGDGKFSSFVRFVRIARRRRHDEDARAFWESRSLERFADLRSFEGVGHPQPGKPGTSKEGRAECRSVAVRIGLDDRQEISFAKNAASGGDILPKMRLGDGNGAGHRCLYGTGSLAGRGGGPSERHHLDSLCGLAHWMVFPV